MNKNKTLRISNTEIGSSKEPFIIAEMSGNLNQSLDLGLHPRNYDLLIGKEAKIDLLKGTPSSWGLID